MGSAWATISGLLSLLGLRLFGELGTGCDGDDFGTARVAWLVGVVACCVRCNLKPVGAELGREFGGAGTASSVLGQQETAGKSAPHGP